MGWGCLRRGSSGAFAAAVAGALVPSPATGGARTTPEGIARGAALFLAECAGCHGREGDGDGVADPEMQPRPRDLTSGKFKLRSTWARSPVTNAELLATITNGIPGTAMPSFRYLDSADREALAQFVAGIAGLPDTDEADVVEIPPEPPVTAERLAEGKQLYFDLGCPACHGDEGRGDGLAGPYLKDEWGSKTPPRDLTSAVYKGGDSDRDLYLRFSIGMPGTPMPSYADTVSPERMWSLVMYLQSIRRPPPPPPSDPVAWGRQLVEEKHCLACHSLPHRPSHAGDVAVAPRPSGRRGGAVGPGLDLAARKLNPTWTRSFLLEPRAHGKIYPAWPYRMPDLGLDAAQVDAIRAYLSSLLGRSPERTPSATPPIDDASRLRGRMLYAAACASCHSLGPFSATAPEERRGPGLDRAVERLDHDFIVEYLADPKRYDPVSGKERSNLRAEDLRAVVRFLWAERGLDAPRSGREAAP